MDRFLELSPTEHEWNVAGLKPKCCRTTSIADSINISLLKLSTFSFKKTVQDFILKFLFILSKQINIKVRDTDL